MKSIFTLLVLIVSINAHGFQCGQDHSDESVFANANSVYVVKVNSVEFYKNVEGGEHAKLLLAKFEVKETLKGESKSSGEVTDLAGIGTGFVNFIPGVYYILAISEQLEGLTKDHVSFCEVLAGAFHLKDEEFRETLTKLRKLAKNS